MFVRATAFMMGKVALTVADPHCVTAGKLPLPPLQPLLPPTLYLPGAAAGGGSRWPTLSPRPRRSSPAGPAAAARQRLRGRCWCEEPPPAPG